MKKALSLILAAALMSVGFAAIGSSVSADETTISTADEYIAFVKEANEAGAEYKVGETIKITADLDFTGKDFVVIENMKFAIDGDGHTLSGINVNVGEVATGQYGILAKKVTNFNFNGTIKNLTLKDSSITVASTAAEFGGQWNHGGDDTVSVGAITGFADRARVGIDITLDNVSINVTGKAYVGAIAGFKEWQAGNEDVYNVTFKGVKINAPDATVGLVAGATHNSNEGKVEKVSGTIAVKAANEVTAATVFGQTWDPVMEVAEGATASVTVTEYTGETAGDPTTGDPTTGDPTTGDPTTGKTEPKPEPKPDKPANPSTGSASVVIAAVAVVALAGAVVASKKRDHE